MRAHFEGHLHINEELASPILPVKTLKYAAIEQWVSDCDLGWSDKASGPSYFPCGGH